MRTASITEAKNGLSALIDAVKEGESVLILERGVPVARLEPVQASELEDEQRIARLERKGIITRRGRGNIVETLRKHPPIKPRSGTSVLEALLEERREARY